MSNADVVNRVYAGFAAGDINAVVATFADDIQWTEAAGFPYAGTFAGAEAIVTNMFMRLGTEWDGYKAEPDLGDQRRRPGRGPWLVFRHLQADRQVVPGPLHPLVHGHRRQDRPLRAGSRQRQGQRGSLTCADCAAVLSTLNRNPPPRHRCGSSATLRGR